MVSKRNVHAISHREVYYSGQEIFDMAGGRLKVVSQTPILTSGMTVLRSAQKSKILFSLRSAVASFMFDNLITYGNIIWWRKG